MVFEMRDMIVSLGKACRLNVYVGFCPQTAYLYTVKG